MSEKPTDRPVVETTLRVRYAETDAMGVVYHTNYIVWFEVGRGEYSLQLGADYGRWEEGGFLLPVTEVWCRYLAPARYGDLVVVSTWVKDVRSRAVTFGYQVRMQESGQVLAVGSTAHICVNREGRPTQIPEDWREALSGGLVFNHPKP